MQKLLTLIVAAAVLLAALSWWLVRDGRGRGTTEAAAAPTAAPEWPASAASGMTANRPAEKIAAERDVDASASPHASTLDWGRRLHESDDFWAFAESAIGLARSGDGYARYWLALALNECEFVYPMYFIDEPRGKPARRLTVDEAQQRVAGQRSLYSADDMILLEKRCSRLSQTQDSPFGNGNEWMEAALAVGNPIALAGAAAGSSVALAHNPGPEQDRRLRAEVQSLSVEAARSGSPEALMHIGSAAANLAHPDTAEARRRELSWMLAACLRTPGCEGLAAWKKKRCNWDAQCQPFETMRDIIRRDAGSDFAEIERRARELNEKIDAGTLEASDI